MPKSDIPNTLAPFVVKYNPIWVKFRRIDHITLLGKDAIAISNGCVIIFKTLPDGEQQLLHCNGDANGEGVSTIAGHKSQPIFAYTEMREYPRLFVLIYPSLTKAMVITCEMNNIRALAFSEGDLLFGISGYPECAIVIWRWRTGEHLSTTPTNKVFNDNIQIEANYSVALAYMSLLVPNTKDVTYWVTGCVGKKCFLRQLPMTFENTDLKLKFSDVKWLNDGYSYAVDCSGNVYKYDIQSYKMTTIISSKEFQGPGIGAFCCFKNGLAVHSPDNVIRYYTKENWEFSKIISSGHDFLTLKSRSVRDYIVGNTAAHDVLIYDTSTGKFQLLRDDEAGITHFGIIPPLNEYFATLSQTTKLSLWESKTGKHVQTINFNTEASSFCCNNLYPYVAVGFATGHLKLYSCIKGVLDQMCKFYLAFVALNEIKMFESQRVIAVANMESGQIFITEGEPGKMFKVIGNVNYGKQIVDYLVVGASSCLRVFIIPVTTKEFYAGNIIVRYCIIRNQEPTVMVYELENPNRLYMALYPSMNELRRDRLFYAVPIDNKNLHELEIKRADTIARILNRIKSDHMMRLIFYQFDPNYICSYGYDGLCIVRNTSFQIKQVVYPHHRFTGGIASGIYDDNNHRLFTLGRDGTLLCGEVPGPPLTNKKQAALFARSEELADMFKQPSIGFNPRGQYEEMCWLEYQKVIKHESERLKFAKQREELLQLLNTIKNEANVLLDHNLNGPPNERLDLQEFNLNLQHRDELVKANKERCEEIKLYLEMLIQEHERVFNLLKAEFWDSIDEPTKNLWAIFGNFRVSNYCNFVMNIIPKARIEQFTILRELEILCSKDTFRPWRYINEDEIKDLKSVAPHFKEESVIRFSALSSEDLQESNLEKEQEFETHVGFHGTTTPMHTDIGNLPYQQMEILTFYQREVSRSMSLEHQRSLRDLFNTEFRELTEQKVKEMALIAERNARLRYIISELNHFSDIDDRIDVNITDPKWLQDEDPILLTKVENNEVGILPYLSPSEQQLLETKAAEEERIRLFLLADDFKERALMKMMNGVLEVRWEDELRREIPKPKCMLQKKPENFTDDDCRKVKEYEEQVAFLNSERKRYKVHLNAEYKRVGNMLREGVKKFNEKLMQLFVKKMQIETAHCGETLRIHRMRIRGVTIMNANAAELRLEKSILENAEIMESVSVEIDSVPPFDDEIRVNVEVVLARDRNVEKTIKREMQDLSVTQTELFSKLIKKRPKINMKLFTTPNTLAEMAKAVQTQTISPLLTGDALDFLNMLNQLDKFVGLPPLIDETTFNNICRLRRLKIESELKQRAAQLEIYESEAMQQFQKHYLSKMKENGLNLQEELETVRQNKRKDLLDIEVQLCLKQAYVELPRTGFITDFQDAILVNRKEVEEINGLIQEAGARKMKAMKHVMQYRKAIMIKEWEHQKKKMEIADLEHALVDIRSVKLTKEIQQYLRGRKRGDVEKIISFEQELASLQMMYWQQCQRRRAKLGELKDNLAQLQTENRRLNKEIIELNIVVNEANNVVDHSLSEREIKLNLIRTKANLKRSKMAQQIQKNHTDILMLQAQLELYRLKTVPILDYKILS